MDTMIYHYIWRHNLVRRNWTLAGCCRFFGLDYDQLKNNAAFYDLLMSAGSFDRTLLTCNWVVGPCGPRLTLTGSSFYPNTKRPWMIWRSSLDWRTKICWTKYWTKYPILIDVHAVKLRQKDTTPTHHVVPEAHPICSYSELFHKQHHHS